MGRRGWRHRSEPINSISLVYRRRVYGRSFDQPFARGMSVDELA